MGIEHLQQNQLPVQAQVTTPPQMVKHISKPSPELSQFDVSDFVVKRSTSVKNLMRAKLNIQTNLPTITKDRFNPYTNSSYASLDAINSQLVKIANKFGIVITHIPVTTDSKIGVAVQLDHPESGEFIIFPPYFMSRMSNNNSKGSQIQKEGGVMTYLKRYALSAIFNIVVDDDQDGNVTTNNLTKGASQCYSQKSQKILTDFTKIVNDKVNQYEITNRKAFLKYMYNKVASQLSNQGININQLSKDDKLVYLTQEIAKFQRKINR